MTVDLFKVGMSLRRVAVISLVATFFTCCLPPGFAQAVMDSNVGFSDRIEPFLSKHCVRCHNKDKAEGELRIDKLTGSFKMRQEADHWVEILDRINLGEMPPQDEPQPTADELSRITDWITMRLQSVQRRARQQWRSRCPASVDQIGIRKHCARFVGCSFRGRRRAARFAAARRIDSRLRP